jgi:hypothetical protein
VLQSPELALFDVVVSEFDARLETPVSRIVRVFGVDESTAQTLVSALPAMVCQGVNAVRAAHFARALVSIGARIEVRDRSGASVALDELLGESQNAPARSSREVQAESSQSLPANDVEPVSQTRTPPLVNPKAATLFRGSDALADTLGATPTPAPQAPRLSRAEIEVLQHEPTAPRIAAERLSPPPPERAAWGELQREPARTRPGSQPLAARPSGDVAAPRGLTSGGPGPRELSAAGALDPQLSLAPLGQAAASQPLTAAGQHPAMRGLSKPLGEQAGQPLTAAGQHPAMRGLSRPLGEQACQPLTAAGQHPAMRGLSRPLGEQAGQPLTAAGQHPAMRGLSKPLGAQASRPLSAGQRPATRGLSRPLDPQASQPLTAAGQHPAMRGLSKPLGDQAARPPREPSGKQPRSADPGQAPRASDVAASNAGEPEDWSDLGLPELTANNAQTASAGGVSLGPPTAAGGPRLHTLDLSGPSLSLDPMAVRAVATRAGVVYEQATPAARGGAQKVAADDATSLRGGRARGADDATGVRDPRRAPGDENPGRARPRNSGPLIDSPAAARAASPAGHRAPPPSAASVEHDPSEFWEDFPDTLSFPFRGSGFAWLASIGVWAICSGVLSVLAWIAPMAGWTVMFFANSSVIAISADYHRRCMWAVANHDAPLEQGPDFDPTRILQEYVRAGAHLTAFMFVSQVPLWLWLASMLGQEGLRALDLLFSVRFWFLAALPGLYWPMAVATASLYNRAPGVWFVPVGVRAIVRAPLAYAAIATAGGLTFVVPFVVLAVVAREAGVPSSMLLAIAGFPMAASHGVMGALTGLLMRSKSDLFA